MKKLNHIIIAFFLVLVFLNCKKVNDEYDFDIDHSFCSKLTDTTGMHIYYFQPFTEFEWKYESYKYKLQRRQIPEAILKSLSLDQLLLQCVWLDMTPEMLLYNSYQAGFISIYEHFNCVQELYKRKNIHYFLEKKLRTIDIKNMVDGEKCRLYNQFLEFCYIQEDCLSLYKKDEIKCCLDLIFTKVEHLAYLTKLEFPNYNSVDLSSWMLGISNILIIQEYKPFLEELENDAELRAFFDGRMNANKNVISKVTKYGTEYYHTI